MVWAGENLDVVKVESKILIRKFSFESGCTTRFQFIEDKNITAKGQVPLSCDSIVLELFNFTWHYIAMHLE